MSSLRRKHSHNSQPTASVSRWLDHPASRVLTFAGGGIGWSGATTCVSGKIKDSDDPRGYILTRSSTTGHTCNKINDYYFQCVPGTPSTTTSRSTSASSSSSTRVTTTTSRAATTTSQVSTTSSRSTTTSSSPSSTATPGTGTGTGTWAASYTKAKAALAKLSNSDKVKIVTGVGWGNGPCVGNTGAVSSIGYPSLCLQDGPLR